MTEQKKTDNVPWKEILQNISASSLGHLTNTGYLSDIKSQVPNQKLMGRIVTAKIYPPDASILREALIFAQEGDVLAIECAANSHYACWGELRNLAAQVKKLAGVIIAGNVTDIAALRSQPFPVFARGVSALTTRASANTNNGEMNTPINISGVLINPGNIALGDEDGLFVFSEEYIHSILASVKSKEEQDQKKRHELFLKLTSSF